MLIFTKAYQQMIVVRLEMLNALLLAIDCSTYGIMQRKGQNLKCYIRTAQYALLQEGSVTSELHNMPFYRKEGVPGA